MGPQTVRSECSGLIPLYLMETAALIGLVLFLTSEILPFTPLRGNGLLDQVLKSARRIFPHKSHTDRK